jgi:hypothetical protein
MLSREQSEQVRWLWSPGQPAGGKPLTPKLAEEPSISPAEALSLKYWGEGLSPKFQAFWSTLPKSEQDLIDAQAEDFGDLEEYWNRKLSGPRTFIADKLPALDVDVESIGNIVAARAGEPEIRSNPAYANKCLRQIESLIRAAWVIGKAGRTPPRERRSTTPRVVKKGLSWRRV